MAVITIIGAGMMGTGIAWPLADNGHEVRLVGTHLDGEIITGMLRNGIHIKHQRTIPGKVKPYYDEGLSAAMQDTDVVVSGVSSFGVDWFIRRVFPLLRPGVPLLSVTKGVVLNRQNIPYSIPEYLENQLPDSLRGGIPVCAVAGPCIAQELAARRQTSVVFCGRDSSILARLRELFATSYYHISLSADVAGVELCAALKNTYAIAVNLAAGEFQKAGKSGIALMYNPQAALFAQSLHEIGLLVSALGGQLQEVAGLAGAGDLYVTVFGGRNARLGKLLGEGRSFRQALDQMAGATLEGVETLLRVGNALPALNAGGMIGEDDLPLLEHLLLLIRDGKREAFPWERFFLDRPGHSDGV